MKIFLGNAPWLDKKDPLRYGVRAGSRWPHFQKKGPMEIIGGYVPFPHFLASAAAVLESNKKDVLLVDGVAEAINVDEFIKIIKDYGPDLVLLEVSTPSMEYDLGVTRRIKSECGVLKIAFSGMHAPMRSPEFLAQNPFVDFVLFGEYEYTLKELVNALTNGQPLKEVSGLIYREENGNVVINEKRPLINELDELPFYAYHFLPMMNYADTPCGLPKPSVQMLTSRGCPFKCSFCAWPQIIYGGHRYRVRGVDRVLDELEFLIGKYDFKSFYFDDDTVNIGKKRMLGLCSEIKKRGIKLPWAIMARADIMDRELLTAFKDAGLYSLKYGVESGDQELIKNSGKNLDLEKVKEMVGVTQELGIKTHLTFALGLPGETRETIEKTINFAVELDPDSIQFSIVTPFPGSRLYDALVANGSLVSGDWSKFNGSSTSVVCTENLTATDLENSLERAYERWERHQQNKAKKAFKDRLTQMNCKLPGDMGKTLIIRSSYLAHFEDVLELSRLRSGKKIFVLGQPTIEDHYAGDKRIKRLFIYGGGPINGKTITREIIWKLEKEKFDTVVILYNDSHRGTYLEVENMARAFKPGRIIGVNTCYEVFPLQ